MRRRDIAIMVGWLSLALVACSPVLVDEQTATRPAPTVTHAAQGQSPRLPAPSATPTPIRFEESPDYPEQGQIPPDQQPEEPQGTVVAPPGPIDITIQTVTGVMGGPVVRYCFPNDCPGELEPPTLEMDRFAQLARDHRIRIDLRETSPSYVALRLYAFQGGTLNLGETTGFQFPGSTVEWTPEWSPPGRYVVEAEVIWGDSTATYWFTVILPGEGLPDSEPPVPPEAWLVREDGTRVELVRETYCWKDRSGEDVCDLSPVSLPDEYVQLNEGETVRIEFEQPGPDQSIINFLGASQHDLPGSVGFAGIGGISAAAGPQGFEYRPEPGDYTLTSSSYWEDGAHAEYYLLISMPGEPPPTIPPHPPGVFLLLPGDQTVPGIPGSSCWDYGCADGPPPEVTQFYWLGADRAIRLRFEEPIPTTVWLALYAAPWDESTYEPADEAEFVLLGPTFQWLPQVPAGDYVLEILAKWESSGDSGGPTGDSFYWFGVTVP